MKTEDRPFDKLELATELSKVKSEIIKEIGTDFTLAKSTSEGLTKEQITVITEMVNASYSLIKLIRKMHFKYIQQRNDLTNQEIKKLKETLEKQEDRIFRMFLVKPTMIVIMNRNVKDNPIIKDSLGIQETEEELPQSLKAEFDLINEKLKR